MNKKKLLPILCFLSLVPLSSCFFFWPIDLLPGKKTDTETPDTGKSYTTYKTPNYPSNATKDNLNKDTLGLGYDQRYLPSTGDRKILVIPIETSDDSFTKDEITRIEKGFFGESSETGWESVASFYEKSSYGKLRITGEVSPIVRINQTTDQAEAQAKNYDKKNMTYTDAILKSALSAISDSVDLSEYDTDGDGYLDAVWMVYSPRYNSSSDFYWAYTTWSEDDSSFSGKKACCYAWASVDFLTQKKYTASIFDMKYLADSHTFIHETGHMLGLDDYYSYDYEYSKKNPDGNADTPVGGVDMMDFNIGDHDSYSKYLLGWLSPTVITEQYLQANDYSLTLRSQNRFGEAFLVPVYNGNKALYNGTPYDEYLLIEYYTPDGLNEQDSEELYTNNLSTYQKSGVLVYHVNATVGKLLPESSKSIVWDGCAYDKLPPYSSAWGYEYLYSLIYSNTYSRSYDPDLKDTNLSYYRGRLISLLPATGRRINGSKTGFADNDVLYQVGTTFGGTHTYSDFCFDDGNPLAYSFTVSSTSDKDCVLKFSSL